MNKVHVALLSLVVAISSLARSAEVPALVLLPVQELLGEADLITAKLSTSASTLRLLERAALESLASERELSSTTLTTRLSGADAALLLESAMIEDRGWLIARLVAAQTSAVLGVEIVPADDAEKRRQWPQRVAAMVQSKIPRAHATAKALMPVSLVNFRRAFQEGALNELTKEPEAARLLVDQLGALPGVQVLDRFNLVKLRFEKALRPVSEDWWQTGWLIDGTYQPQGNTYQAMFTLRRAGQAAVNVIVTSQKPGLHALIQASALALADKLGTAPGLAFKPEVEARRYALEATWLWSIGLRAPAVQAASAAQELGSLHPSARSVPVMNEWFDAWPNLTRVIVDPKDNIDHTLYLLDFLGREDAHSYLFLMSDSSTTWIHPVNDNDMRPKPTQMQAVGRALEELVNQLSKYPTEPENERVLNPDRSRWQITLSLGAHLLCIEYAHPANDPVRDAAARVLRQQMRSALQQMSERRPWYLSMLPPWSALLADNLSASSAAYEEWVKSFGKPNDPEALSGQLSALEGWAGSHVHWCDIMSVKHLPEQLPHVPLYDWGQRDQAAAMRASNALFERWVNSSATVARVHGQLHQILWNSQDSQAPARLLNLLKQLSADDFPAVQIRMVVSALLNLDVTHPWTRQALDQKKPELLDAWVTLAIKLLNADNLAGEDIALSMAPRCMKDLPGRARWTTPLFDALQRFTLKSPQFRKTDKESIARSISHVLAEPSVPSQSSAAAASKPVLLQRWWPNKQNDLLSRNLSLEAADLYNGSAYVVPAWGPSNPPSEIKLVELKLPDLKVARSWRLPWRHPTELDAWNNVRSLRVLDGKAHIGIGSAQATLNLSSGRIEHQYRNIELASLRSVWHKDHWFGYTANRAELGGELIAEVDAAAGKHRMLADSLRNPPLHSFDGPSRRVWSDAWPLVPVGPDSLLAPLGPHNWQVFNLKTGQPSPWLERDSGFPNDGWSNSPYNSRMSSRGNIFTLAGMGKPSPGVCHWNVISFDATTREHEVLLWCAQQRLHVAGKAPDKAPIFNQPPDPDYIMGGRVCSPLSFDGERLVAISAYCDRQLHPRLHVWQRGQADAKTLLLDVPECRMLDIEAIERFHGGLSLVGDRPAATVGKISIDNLCSSPDGVLLNCSSFNSQAQGLTFLTWQELGL